MKARPILFSGPMVRAQLAGLKTQTRRICKPAMEQALSYVVSIPGADAWGDEEGLGTAFHCPYGKPGDLLWVRETYWAWGRWETRYSAKKRRDEWHFIDMTLECGHSYVHDADSPDNALRITSGRAGAHPNWWKRPAIFMPMAASRLTNRLTAVRVERLQDISEADARTEGAPPSHPSIDHISAEIGYADTFARSWYAQLWDQINGPGSWAANPWVWGLSFEVIRENVDAYVERHGYAPAA